MADEKDGTDVNDHVSAGVRRTFDVYPPDLDLAIMDELGWQQCNSSAKRWQKNLSYAPYIEVPPFYDLEIFNSIRKLVFPTKMNACQ